MNALLKLIRRRRLRARGIFIDDVTQLNRHVELEVESPCHLNGMSLSSVESGVVPRIGRFTYFRSGVKFASLSSIGRFCSVAKNVRGGEQSHPMGWLSTHPFLFDARYSGRPECMRDPSPFHRKPPVIGNDVWLGIDAMIMCGVTIGDGAVVAAGSIVTKDVQPYEIVGGAPARHIRFRFPPEIIQELLATRWWDCNPAELVELDCADVARFIVQFREARLRPMPDELWRIARRGQLLERLPAAPPRPAG